ESLGRAIDTLETARKVAELPGVDQALREGRLSSPQAAHIADAASARNPSCSMPPRPRASGAFGSAAGG
ncbi:MAG: hypothetical protein ACRDJ4_08930, partial [Actinomycetota bacterium]